MNHTFIALQSGKVHIANAKSHQTLCGYEAVAGFKDLGRSLFYSNLSRPRCSDYIHPDMPDDEVVWVCHRCMRTGFSEGIIDRISRPEYLPAVSIS